MNPAILHQAVQRQAGNFATYRIEARNNNGFGRIVDDNFDTGCRFEGPDVTAFPTDHLSFDIVRFDIEHRDAVFDCVFGSRALNGFDDHFLGFFGGRQLGFFDDVFDVRRGPRLGFGLERIEELFARLFGREASNAFELRYLIGQHLIGFLLPPFYFFAPFVEGIRLLGQCITLLIQFVALLIEFLFAVFLLIGLLIKLLFALLQFVFVLLQQIAFLTGGFFKFCLQPDVFILGFEHAFFFKRFGLQFRIFQDCSRFFVGFLFAPGMIAGHGFTANQ